MAGSLLTGRNRVLTPTSSKALLNRNPICEFCGEHLEPFKVLLFGVEKTVGYGPCDCKGNRERTLRSIEEDYHKHPNSVPRKYEKSDGGLDYANQVLDGRWLFIYGDVGVGKTYLASAILNHLSSKGSCEFISAVESTGLNAQEPLKNARFLVIDDFGKETASDWSLAKIWEVINHRYNECKPTIFTSQYTMEEIPERMARNGDYETALSVISRMYEMCDTVHLKGNDRRIG